MTESTEDRARADETERTLAKATALGLPLVTVLAALAVGSMFNVAAAILVLAAGALVGVIGLIWASLRTLGGDAPLAEGLVDATMTRAIVTDRAERKRRVLRALKDLELEHSIGKIDDADYAEISARYREQAKGILREQDVEIEPLRAKAEAIARAHLEGSAPPAPHLPERSVTLADTPTAKRLPCPKCATSNEPDATFCKKCGTKLGAEVSDASA
jgi:ribosomal protein L40E